MCSREAGRMSGRKQEGGMWAAASGNYCFLSGRGMMTSQTAVPETTEHWRLQTICPNTHMPIFVKVNLCDVFLITATVSKVALRLQECGRLSELSGTHLWRFFHYFVVFGHEY